MWGFSGHQCLSVAGVTLCEFAADAAAKQGAGGGRGVPVIETSSGKKVSISARAAAVTDFSASGPV